MKKLLMALMLSMFATSTAYSQLSFDLVDDFFNASSGGFTGAGAYDIFSFGPGGGSVGPDGTTDIVLTVATTGETTNDGNNVSWTALTDTTTTGLRSTIDPSFVSGGGVTANNSGYRVSQTIQIDFVGIDVTAADITDFGWSSGNTAGVAWETSVLQYLDANGNPFSPAPTNSLFLSHAPINMQSGIGTFVADDTGSVTQVGTDLVVSGSSGSNNGLSTTPTGLGLSPSTIIGGVRFIHNLEDVRGINNGDTIFTATINDLDLEGFSVSIPEPGSFGVIALASLVGIGRRRRG